MPAAEASQWVDDTIPQVPRSSGRVPNTPEGLLWHAIYRSRQFTENYWQFVHPATVCLDRPSGCRFHTRCPLADERSRSEVPALRDVTGAGHLVACHQVGDGGAAPSIIEQSSTTARGPRPR